MTNPVIKSKRLVGVSGGGPLVADVLVFSDPTDPGFPDYILTMANAATEEDLSLLIEVTY